MKKHLRVFIPAVLLVFLFSCKKDNVTDNLGEGNTQKPDFAYGVKAADLLNLVNQVRKAGCNCGGKDMPPVDELVWSDVLAQVAYGHSEDMKANDYFDHVGSDKSTPGSRISASGYVAITYGENIALGQPTEQVVMNSWLKSEGHCKNIMNAGFKEMGVGRIDNYWTQVFAAKK